MKPNNLILAIFLATIFLSISIDVSGAEVRGETVTAAEAASIPPVCKLILIEQPNAHIDSYAQKKNAALFDRPEYQMAKNAIHLHHWCRATILRYRYFNASSSQKKRGYMSDFHDEMDYVIRNMHPNWPYMPMMHVENGEMYLLEKNYVEAVAQALSAINQSPTFTRGHVFLVNIYNAMGQKNKALEAATEGLRYIPTSSVLKQLYDEAGGAKPYPEPYTKPTESASELRPQPSQTKNTDTRSSNEAASLSPPVQQSNESAPISIPEGSVAPENTTNQKKYCRFCP